MKQLVFLTCVCVVAISLSTGCRKAQPPRPHHTVIVRKPKTTNAQVAHAPKPQPVKPPKEIRPGTISYLDSKDGFRDVTFGEMESSIANLVLKDQDEARQIKTFTRSGDVLFLEGVPLDSIEYSFFQGQLLEVQLKWSLEHADSAEALPPASDVPVHCAAFYGPPTQRSAQRKNNEFVWRGRQAEIILVELRLPGVADRVNGGWAIAPRTSGRMAIRSLPLARIAKIAYFAQIPEKQNGL